MGVTPRSELRQRMNERKRRRFNEYWTNASFLEKGKYILSITIPIVLWGVMLVKAINQ